MHRSIFASTASCPRIRIARYPTTSRRAFSRGLSRHFLIKTSAVNVSCAQLRREAPGGEDFPKESRIASSFTHPLHRNFSRDLIFSFVEQRRLSRLEIENCAKIETILERPVDVDEFWYGSLAPRIIIPRLDPSSGWRCPTFEYLQIMGPARARNSPSFHRNLDRLYFQSRYKCPSLYLAPSPRRELHAPLPAIRSKSIAPPRNRHK